MDPGQWTYAITAPTQKSPSAHLPANLPPAGTAQKNPATGPARQAKMPPMISPQNRFGCEKNQQPEKPSPRRQPAPGKYPAWSEIPNRCQSRPAEQIEFVSFQPSSTTTPPPRLKAPARGTLRGNTA